VSPWPPSFEIMPRICGMVLLRICGMIFAIMPHVRTTGPILFYVSLLFLFSRYIQIPVLGDTNGPTQPQRP
jgi:hypothetical protein